MEQAHQDALIALAERAERAEQALQEFTDARRDDALHILFAHFKDKADEFGVYFFDPLYYETTEPYHANLRLVTNSHSTHYSKLIQTYFNINKSARFLFFSGNLNTKYSGNLKSGQVWI